jgi:AP-3 complex subunit mu
MVSGTIAFTAKVSGVPDLLLTLSTPAGQQAISRKMELPVFHPCVRLARWRDRPGELSFVPPDGRFILADYKTDLLPIESSLDRPPTHMERLFLPAFVDIRKSLGQSGMDFEVRLTLNTNFPGAPSGIRQSTGRSGSGSSTPSFLGGATSSGNSSAPVLEEVVVAIPIPKTVRNITEIRSSRGEATYSPGTDILVWRVPTKDPGTVSGTATLYCTVSGSLEEDEDDLDGADDTEASASTKANLLQGYYGAESYPQDPTTYTSASHPTTEKPKKKKKKAKPTTKTKKSKKSPTSLSRLVNVEGTESTEETTGSGLEQEATPSASLSYPPVTNSLLAREETPSPVIPPANPSAAKSLINQRKAQIKASLMPTSASISFSVRGWLPSGIRVDSLLVDPRRSRGLGEGVRPYKGVKYLCVSHKGVERRF